MALGNEKPNAPQMKDRFGVPVTELRGVGKLTPKEKPEAEAAEEKEPEAQEPVVNDLKG